MQLIVPGPGHLPSHIAALQRGWSPDTTRGIEAAQQALASIAADPAGLFATMDDPDALAPGWTSPDGTHRARIPGLQRWLWDDAADIAPDDADPAPGFAGFISLRWMPAVAGRQQPLPAHVLGHIGYSVVPWRQRRGYATQALAQVLPLARQHGLQYVELTTDPDNTVSQRVITAHGGVPLGAFNKGPAYGNKPGLRFRIDL